jgi:hypothetical protein
MRNRHEYRSGLGTLAPARNWTRDDLLRVPAANNDSSRLLVTSAPKRTVRPPRLGLRSLVNPESTGISWNGFF